MNSPGVTEISGAGRRPGERRPTRPRVRQIPMRKDAAARDNLWGRHRAIENTANPSAPVARQIPRGMCCRRLASEQSHHPPSGAEVTGQPNLYTA
jgi:hypothetical protein